MVDTRNRSAREVFEDHLTRLVEGEAAFSGWTALSESAKVEDGAGSFFVRDGRIAAQTIHYAVEPLGDEQEKAEER